LIEIHGPGVWEPGEDLVVVGGGEQAGRVLAAQRLDCDQIAPKLDWLHRVHGAIFPAWLLKSPRDLADD
jgi:hypothetical protein